MFKNATVLFIVLFIIPTFGQVRTDDLMQSKLEEYGTTSPVNTEITSEIFLDDPSTWNSLLTAPSNFGRSIGGVIGNYLYLHTGQGTTSLAIAYHIPSNTWVNSTPCTGPASNAAFCVANGELYKLSGTGATNVFEKFTPAGDGTGTWTVLTGGPTSVMNAQNSIVWDGGNFIYAYSSGTTSPYPSYLQRYSISDGTWEARAGSLFPRRYSGMAQMNGEIYLIGGLLSDGTSGAICQKYNIAGDSWTQIADLPEVVNFTKWSVTTDGNYIYLVGSGGGFSPYTISSNCYYYNPSNNTWTLESVLPAVRGLAIGLYVNGFTKLFFGGGNDGSSGSAYQDDIWEGIRGIYTPVELSSFTASVVNNGVTLNWTTATETNNSHFVIERSTDKNTFNEISNVPGFGTTTQPQFYSYLDNNTTAGVYYYRLKQIDLDGTFNYSQIIEVDATGIYSFNLEQNYPNPFNPSTVIKYQIADKQFVSLKVYDILGNVVDVLKNEIQSSGNYEIKYDGTSLASGTYIYKLQAGEFISSKKMLVIK